jgi:hypothetical protein
VTPPADRRAWVVATVALALTLAPPGGVLANSREAEVKAAYVYKLASFVRWPPAAYSSATMPTTLCVSGRGDILADLTRMAKGQRADDRALVVVGMAPGSKTALGCNALYLGVGGKWASQLVQSLGSAPVLTISDREAGSEGGVIELVDHGDTVRLVIHRGEASRRGLTLSSKLLSVAEAIEP